MSADQASTIDLTAANRICRSKSSKKALQHLLSEGGWPWLHQEKDPIDRLLRAGYMMKVNERQSTLGWGGGEWTPWFRIVGYSHIFGRLYDTLTSRVDWDLGELGKWYPYVEARTILKIAEELPTEVELEVAAGLAVTVLDPRDLPTMVQAVLCGAAEEPPLAGSSAA